MKEGERVAAGRVGSSRPARLLDGERLNLEVLRFLGQDREIAHQFFSLAGLDAPDLRAAVAQPGFLPAALDFLISDDRLLERFAEHAGLGPHDIAATARALRERETWSGDEP